MGEYPYPGIRSVPSEEFAGHKFVHGEDPASCHPAVGINLLVFLSGATEGMFQVCPARLQGRDVMALILKEPSGEWYILAILVDAETFDEGFVLELPGDEGHQVTEGTWALVSRIAHKAREKVRPVAIEALEESMDEMGALVESLVRADLDEFLAEVLEEGGEA